MKILVINSGSSSLKYQLFDMEARVPMASGVVERIGDAVGVVTHKKAPGTAAEVKTAIERPIPDHAAGMQLMMELVTGADSSKDTGVIKSADEIDGVGHRVVHGGEAFREPILIDDAVLAQIRAFVPLAPLHNPAGLTGIETAERIFPGKPQVAVFDTSFHQTMPPRAYVFPLPYDLYEELRVRRYGFHGTSHKYVTKRAAEFLGKPADQVNIVTLHLGNGCSMAAVKNGKCIDTSMGLTPLDGLMMGTRCGAIDPAIPAFLSEQKGWDIKKIDSVLNKESGLKGVCGLNDMRDIHNAREKGDERAQLAFEMFCYRIKKFVGAYAAAIGALDSIVFTAGIGENDDFVREAVCADMGVLGISLDTAKNGVRSPEPRDISLPESRVRVLVVPTNEELEIASETADVLSR